MDWAFWKALALAIPEVLRLLKGVQDLALIKKGDAAGYSRAVKDGLVLAAAALAVANQADAETDAAHKADPSDGAFDPEFKRD